MTWDVSSGQPLLQLVDLHGHVFSDSPTPWCLLLSPFSFFFLVILLIPKSQEPKLHQPLFCPAVGVSTFHVAAGSYITMHSNTLSLSRLSLRAFILHYLFQQGWFPLIKSKYLNKGNGFLI